MPAEYGSVTPRAAAVATAASTALPPRRSTARPTFVALGSTDDTAPPKPTAVGCLSVACVVVGVVGGLATAALAVRLVRTRAPADRDAASFFTVLPWASVGRDENKDKALPIPRLRCALLVARLP